MKDLAGAPLLPSAGAAKTSALETRRAGALSKRIRHWYGKIIFWAMVMIVTLPYALRAIYFVLAEQHERAENPFLCAWRHAETITPLLLARPPEPRPGHSLSSETEINKLNSKTGTGVRDGIAHV